VKGSVYILTNNNNSVLYTRVTSNLKERTEQHKNKKHPDSFTARYNLCKLVYYEWLDTIGEAIEREKIIKGGNRRRKLDLINSTNPGWRDLSTDLDQG
jgi:putative endonuclease